jgi:hypothetical protein
MIGIMNDIEKPRAAREHLRLAKAPALTHREARSISKRISKIGALPIPASRLEELSAGARAREKGIESLHTLNQHSAIELPALRARASRLRNLRRRVTFWAFMVWAFVLSLYLLRYTGELANSGTVLNWY